MSESIEFSCPRCGDDAREAYYGPCGTCRDDLKSIYAAERREVEVAEYEPKMNVVPNAVASKD